MVLFIYRTIDKEGQTLDIQLRKKRDTQAAYTFIKQLVQTFGEPKVLTTDKTPSLLCTLKKLKMRGLYKNTTHSTIKHFINYIEQEHRHASRTIKGI